MKLFIYIVIFGSKVLENSLATLRLIVVANGKKTLGAFLLLATSLIWISVTGLVLINLNSDPLKVIFFALGTFVGSYSGSWIEEKMALGNNLLITIIDKDDSEEIANNLRTNNFALTSICGNGIDQEKIILLIVVSRKKRKNAVNIIMDTSPEAMIIAESAFTINGGYPKKKV